MEAEQRLLLLLRRDVHLHLRMPSPPQGPQTETRRILQQATIRPNEKPKGVCQRLLLHPQCRSPRAPVAADRDDDAPLFFLEATA